MVLECILFPSVFIHFKARKNVTRFDRDYLCTALCTFFKLRTAIHSCVGHETELANGNWNFSNKPQRRGAPRTSEVRFFTASCISVRLCTVYGVILQNAALTVETSQEAGSHITETQVCRAVNTEMRVFVGLQSGLHTHWRPHLLCLELAVTG